MAAAKDKTTTTAAAVTKPAKGGEEKKAEIKAYTSNTKLGERKGTNSEFKILYFYRKKEDLIFLFSEM